MRRERKKRGDETDLTEKNKNPTPHPPPFSTAPRLALQHRLEAVPAVERAFVHIDYERRAEPEHAVDRALSGLAPMDAASPNVPAGVRGG